MVRRMWPPKGKGVPGSSAYVRSCLYDRDTNVRLLRTLLHVCVCVVVGAAESTSRHGTDKMRSHFFTIAFFFAFFQSIFSLSFGVFFTTMRLLFGRDSPLLRRLVYYLYRVNI